MRSTAASGGEPDGLRGVSYRELLIFAYTGAPDGELADAIEAIIDRLEPLYEALDLRGELWASNDIHGVQCQLRVIAELVRRGLTTRG